MNSQQIDYRRYSIQYCTMEDKALFSFGLDTYPQVRDLVILPTPLDWLTLKKSVDKLHSIPLNSAEPAHPNLWRIHDELYDLNSLNHPGGNAFIQMTANTDITELFESSHINIEKAKVLLQKFKVKTADKQLPKRSTRRFSFEPNGFYCILRERVKTYLNSISPNGPTVDYFQSTAFIHDFLLFGGITSSILSILPFFSSSSSLIFAGIAGIFIACLGNCAHNFFHLRDNWRMYSFDLTLSSSWEWRISHVYSHHTYPNSVLDYEVSAFEPFVNYLPYNSKNSFIRYVTTCAAFCTIFPVAKIIGVSSTDDDNLFFCLIP